MSEDPRVREFRAVVWRYYREHGRHDLAWRRTRDPYRILVSEVMLQQTQVPRVIEKYKEFLKAFPTVHALAAAPLADVLRVWSGMGYNRRAKYLLEGAKTIVGEHSGRVPKDAATLRSIPGIGPYTASAILIFAYNTPDTMIETNIRAAHIHHFYPHQPEKETQHKCSSKLSNCENHRSKKINDRDLLPFISKAAEGQDPRAWHWALMDYGSHLKKLHGNPSRKSAHHTKQSKFEGSLRQVRGAILRAQTQGTPLSEVKRRYADKYKEALTSLRREGLIT